MFSKQDLVKNQWLAIVLTSAVDGLALLVALTAEDNFLVKLAWAAVVLTTLFLLGLVMGLRTAKLLQHKIDTGDLSDSRLRRLNTRPVYDERQQSFLLRSYAVGFWYAMAVFVLSIFVGRFWSDVISLDFMVALGLYGGVGLTMTLANLKGVSPFVDDRFGRQGQLMGWVATLFGLLITLSSLLGTIAEQEMLSTFFIRGGSGSLFVLGLCLFSMGASILYRRYQDKKEEDE